MLIYNPTAQSLTYATDGRMIDPHVSVEVNQDDLAEGVLAPDGLLIVASTEPVPKDQWPENLDELVAIEAGNVIEPEAAVSAPAPAPVDRIGGQSPTATTARPSGRAHRTEP